jgi:pyruvate kinase
LKPAAVFSCTLSGNFARRLAAFRLPVWMVAITPNLKTVQDLLFSSGVIAAHQPEPPESWISFIKNWVKQNQLPGSFAILAEPPSASNAEPTHRMEIIDL